MAEVSESAGQSRVPRQYEERTSELTAPSRDVYRQCSTLPAERDVNTHLNFHLVRLKPEECRRKQRKPVSESLGGGRGAAKGIETKGRVQRMNERA